MNVTFLQTAEDLQWLREVHLSAFTLPLFGSAMLYGNEDAPECIELFRRADPWYADIPVTFFTFTPEAAQAAAERNVMRCGGGRPSTRTETHDDQL